MKKKRLTQRDIIARAERRWLRSFLRKQIARDERRLDRLDRPDYLGGLYA